MKILNAHTTENWETIPVAINGFLLQLPVFPLRARGESWSRKPIAAFWGDPDNLDKLWFVVQVEMNGNASTWKPFGFIDPMSAAGARQIESIYDREQRMADELPCEAEARRLRAENAKLKQKLKERLK